MRSKLRGVPLIVTIAGAIALAACGSSGSTAATKTTPTTVSSSTTASPTSAPISSSPPVANTADNAKLGTILVDADGKTLYTLTNNASAVACTGQCLTFWPPLLLAAGTTTATGGAGVTGLATTSAAGGTQVTAGGLPLYRFSGDSAAGTANGEGLSSFGGTWHAVKVAGASGSAPTTVAPAAASTTTSSGGYGY